jgi:hypothetical protein
VRNRFGAVLLVFGSVAIVLGCSTTVSKDDLKKQLTESNTVDAKQADCIVDGLVAKGVPLNKFGSPSDAEKDTITSVTTDCILGSSDDSVTTTTP